MLRDVSRSRRDLPLNVLQTSVLLCPGALFRSATYRKSVLKVADARISLMGEVIDGIKTVKLNSLDAAFRARVEALRVQELASIRHALTLNACNQVWKMKKSVGFTLC